MRIGLEGQYAGNAVQQINGLKPGYYSVEADTLNDGKQKYCYIYGRGTGQDKCMTAVPRTIKEEQWTKVTVRGIKVETDGQMEVGVCTDGDDRNVHIDNVSLQYEANQDKPFEMLNGGCIGWLDWIEDLGGKYYYSDGTEGDALQILAESGFNFVRLELYNNPGEHVKNGEMFPKGYKDPDGIFRLAVRARDKGMKIQLSFMYSDYWENEAIPYDWLEKIEELDDNDEIADILSECIYTYTRDYLKRLADAGIYPEFISLGNEMQEGILRPYGRTCEDECKLNNFCKFMAAGYKAVKEVSPGSKVVLHIACNADDMHKKDRVWTGRWFFDMCRDQGIQYDVIGTSFYPFWAQKDEEGVIKPALDVNDFREWCNMMIDIYDKDILIMETGINWGTPGQLENNGAYEGIYPYSPEGQRDYMYELINGVKSVKDGRCVGILYWDPVLVHQEGAGYAVDAVTGEGRPNCVETTTLFDYDHKALPVLDAYRYNTVSDGSVAVYGVAKDDAGNILANSRVEVTHNGKTYSVNTDRYGGYYTRVFE